MKPKQVIRVIFVINAKYEHVPFSPIIGEEDFYGVMDVAIILEQEDLFIAGMQAEKGQFPGIPGQGDVGVSFLFQELA